MEPRVNDARMTPDRRRLARAPILPRDSGAGTTAAESPVTAFERQWPEALAELDAGALGMMRRLLNSGDSSAVVEIEALDDACAGWRIGARMVDRVGMLAAVSGTLTANGLEIVQADTFTISPEGRGADGQAAGSSYSPRGRARRPGGRRGAFRRGRLPPGRPAPARAVMLFDARAGTESALDRDALRADLEAICLQAGSGEIESAWTTATERVAETMRRSGGRIVRDMPMEISADDTSSDAYALLEIRSIDTPGFLFAFSSALASVRVNVVRSSVRTRDGEVHDTFWLTEPSGGRIASKRRLRQVTAAAALIKQFAHLLPTAADPVQALRQFNSLTSMLLAKEDWSSDIEGLESPGVLETLAEMMGASRFLWEEFLRMQPENLFPALLDAPGLRASRSRGELAAEAERLLAGGRTHNERVRILNDFKDREMFRINLRCITGRIGRQQSGAELAELAEVVVERAFEMSVEAARARLGKPTLADGRECGWAALALGKFGGLDMGFGSDIELMFVYEGEGATDGERRERSSVFFDEAVREFMRALETRRKGIFEIDLRLRPYGSKGALASSLKAFEGYYGESGDARHFERLALVRLRQVAGDAALGQRIMRARDAFVYSPEPLDMEDIRHLRRRQADELVERGAVNAKFSQGGLVDIEYYVQAWQILRGGSDTSVRRTNTMDAVESLRARGCIGDELARRVAEAYGFIRELIDALRVVRGNATDLTVPQPDAKEFHYLAHRLGMDDPSELDALIRERMESSRRLWEELPE